MGLLSTSCSCALFPPRPLRIYRMRRTAKAMITALGTAAGAAAIERRFFAAPRYRGPITDHFDGRRFYNRKRGQQSERAFLKWMLNRQRGHWQWLDEPY